MKKLLALASLILTLAFVLSACGTDTASASTPTPTATPVSASNSTTDSTPEPAPEPQVSNFDTSKNISIVAREDGSGTKSAFMEIIGLKGKADPANVIIQTGTAGVLAEVKSNPAAIAYESLGYVTADVKMLDVDGVEATVANIQNDTYKISRPLSIVYQESTLENEVNAAFYAFLQSSDAQDIISEEGYVSIANNASPYTINGSLSGTIDISGSTSLQPLMIELEAAFKVLQPNVTVNVSGGGSGTGYKNADEGVSEFGMISEVFSLEKAPSCTHYIVAKDGIAVIVNGDNPLGNITMDELKNIYDEETTDVLKWDSLIK
ncbi:MAG: substrate-binding domain-containing protein [Oscillospiraceae bacterium]|nr:substrate-binding domain-containing protein [Oscillospiraceae bacterium]